MWNLNFHLEPIIWTTTWKTWISQLSANMASLSRVSISEGCESNPALSWTHLSPLASQCWQAPQFAAMHNWSSCFVPRHQHHHKMYREYQAKARSFARYRGLTRLNLLDSTQAACHSTRGWLNLVETKWKGKLGKKETEHQRRWSWKEDSPPAWVRQNSCRRQREEAAELISATRLQKSIWE